MRFSAAAPARCALLALLSVALLSLALAPVWQFYLAWIGLAPLLVCFHERRSAWTAFAAGMLAGWAYFLVNMWWLWRVTGPGMIALTIYLSIFWGFAGVVIRALLARPVHRAASAILTIVLMATVWTGFEWLRGNVSFLGRQGLPWLYLGQTQSPILFMCQIADITGITGVTWWVALVNSAAAVAFLQRGRLRLVVPAMVAVAALVLAIAGYGAWRMSVSGTNAGPTVMVVQSSYPQSNTGEKGAPIEEIVAFHLRTTRDALEAAKSRGQKVDLVVWSETMMPPINPEARMATAGTAAGALWQEVADALAALARRYEVHLLAGGVYYGNWRERGDRFSATDRRNSTYFFLPDGSLSPTRYDKIHLVPFGEYIPFKESIPPLYQLFIRLGPNYYEEYVLTPGTEAAVFDMTRSRFIVPICFEDIVPGLVAGMLRGDDGKRADFMVNITNDGWFGGSQMSQHLQTALFRSIENRVPTARSVNTGISAFVDSFGRVSGAIPAGTEGTAIQTLSIDPRYSFYTRFGDVFALVCVGATLGVAGWMFAARLRYKSGIERIRP